MEYVVVLAALMVVIAGCALLWRGVSGALLVDHALMAASHTVSAAAGWTVDVFCF